MSATSAYLRQPSIPRPPFFKGDAVYGMFGNATVLDVYWEVPRPGIFWTSPPHWRAVIVYSELPDAPRYDVPMQHLKPGRRLA